MWEKETPATSVHGCSLDLETRILVLGSLLFSEITLNNFSPGTGLDPEVPAYSARALLPSSTPANSLNLGFLTAIFNEQTTLSGGVFGPRCDLYLRNICK